MHITKTMKNIEVPETKTASFECEVSHFNVPSVWLKNGVEIEMSEKFKIVVQGKLHQLNIVNTSSEDSAEYTFICGNDKVSATLTVKRKFETVKREGYFVEAKVIRSAKHLERKLEQAKDGLLEQKWVAFLWSES